MRTFQVFLINNQGTFTIEADHLILSEKTPAVATFQVGVTTVAVVALAQVSCIVEKKNLKG